METSNKVCSFNKLIICYMIQLVFSDSLIANFGFYCIFERIIT